MKGLTRITHLMGIGLVFASAHAYADNSIRIGLAGPFTGQYATIGDNILHGATLAVDTINQKGGVNGKKIVIVKGDDACEPKQSVAVATRMVEVEHVDAVVGHICSSGTLPASKVYEEAGILNMTPASTNPEITERGLTLNFRMIGRDDQQGMVAGDFLVKTLKAKKIAVIDDQDSYGVGIANAVISQIAKYNVKPLFHQSLTRGEQDFNALVTKVKASGADAVYFGGTYPEAGPLVRQLREQGLTIPMVTGDGTFNPQFITTAGGARFAKGTFITFGRDPQTIPEGASVVAAFKAENYNPAGFTLYTYASIQAIAAAMKATNGTDGVVLSKWLKSHTVDTILGPKAWNGKGDLTAGDYTVYVVGEDGAFSEYKH